MSTNLGQKESGSRIVWAAGDCQTGLTSEAEIKGFLKQLRQELGGDPELPSAVYRDDMTQKYFGGLTGQSLNQLPQLRVLTFPEQFRVCGDISFPLEQIPFHTVIDLVTATFRARRVEVGRNLISDPPKGLVARLTLWDNE